MRLQYAVQTQHVAMLNLALMLAVKQCAADLGHVAVHVPLYVVDMGALRSTDDTASIDVVAHVRTRQVEYQLLARLSARRGPAHVCTSRDGRDTDHCPGDTISGSNHRPNFMPNACIRFAQMPSRPLGSFSLSDNPVAQRAVVGIALAEPAVVQHEQLQTQLLAPPWQSSTIFSSLKSK